MSLNADWSRVRDFDPMKLTDDEWVTAQVVIFRTMAVGLGEITEANLRDFYVRSRIWESLFSPRDTSLSLETFSRFIGLRTNVANETKAAWRRRMMENAEREWYRAADKALGDLSDKVHRVLNDPPCHHADCEDEDGIIRTHKSH